MERGRSGVCKYQQMNFMFTRGVPEKKVFSLQKESMLE